MVLGQPLHGKACSVRPTKCRAFLAGHTPGLTLTVSIAPPPSSLSLPSSKSETESPSPRPPGSAALPSMASDSVACKRNPAPCMKRQTESHQGLHSLCQCLARYSLHPTLPHSCFTSTRSTPGVGRGISSWASTLHGRVQQKREGYASWSEKEGSC